MTEETNVQALVLPEQDQKRDLATIPDNSPAGMMLAAMRQGATLEQVEKMMDLQERWERREAEKAFRDAFAAFRGENIIIPKGKFVDRGRGGSFHQAEYDEVCRRLSPALSRHGFSFRHDQKFGYKRIMEAGAETDVPWAFVTCYLEHKAGHVETLQLDGPPGDQTVNTPVQNMQLTASFLKRQSLLAITGTATGGEDDENKLQKTGGQQTEPDDRLIEEGRTAAMEGMARLNAWWGGLDGKQRKDLSKEFGQMRKAAMLADEKGPGHE